MTASSGGREGGRDRDTVINFEHTENYAKVEMCKAAEGAANSQ